MKLFLRLLINVATLLMVDTMLDSVQVNGIAAACIAALLLSIFNAVLRPLLILVTLPLNILSLGVFTLIINAFMFYLTAKLVPGFTVNGFWAAFWGALLFAIVNFVFNKLVKPGPGRVQVRTWRSHAPQQPQEQPRRGTVIDAEIVSEERAPQQSSGSLSGR